MNTNVSGGIDWDSLPEDANYVAMDDGDSWWYYKKLPAKGRGGWACHDNELTSDYDTFKGPPCDDWTKSLQSRPSPSVAVPSPSKQPIIEPLTEQERTVVNAEIASLNEQLRSALEANAILLTRLKNAEDDWRKVSQANVAYRDEIESLKIALDEYRFDNEGLRALLKLKGTATDDDDNGTFSISHAIDRVFSGQQVTRADGVGADYRMGLYVPVNTVNMIPRLIWTNGIDWHDAVFTQSDYDGMWKVYS